MLDLLLSVLCYRNVRWFRHCTVMPEESLTPLVSPGTKFSASEERDEATVRLIEARLSKTPFWPIFAQFCPGHIIECPRLLGFADTEVQKG